VGKVRERPPAGAFALIKLPVGDEQGRHEAGGEEVEAHYQSCNGQHLARVVYAPSGRSRSSSASPRTSDIG
jgi:hypothetical protein